MPCKFCEIGAGLHRRGVDLPLIESDRYFAVSSIGGFVPGWTLVFPREHRFNMSCDYRTSEFNDFVRQVSAVVSNEYGSCVFFEHGALKQDSQTSCGVNHAHFHIVPLSKSIETLAIAYQPNNAWQKTKPSEIECLHNGAEYLFCCDEFGSDSKGIISILRTPESQFFRKVIASATGLDEFFDYKNFPFDEISTNTAVRLRRSFTIADITA